MKRLHYVYITENLVNGKKYIGQRLCPPGKTPNNDIYFGSGILISKALKKYGNKSFTKEIIFESYSQKEIDKKEIELIDLNQCLENKDIWYNRDPGGQYGRSEHHSKSTSEAMKKFYSNPENKKKCQEGIAKKYGFNSYDEFITDRENKKLNKKIKSEKIKEERRKIREKEKELEKELERQWKETKFFKSFCEMQNRNALKHPEAKQKHHEKQKKYFIEKAKESKNLIAIKLIEKDLFPAKKYIKENLRTYREFSSGWLRTDKKCSTDKIKLLCKELLEKYGINLDIDLCIDWYTEKFGDFKHEDYRLSIIESKANTEAKRKAEKNIIKNEKLLKANPLMRELIKNDLIPISQNFNKNECDIISGFNIVKWTTEISLSKYLEKLDMFLSENKNIQIDKPELEKWYKKEMEIFIKNKEKKKEIRVLRKEKRDKEKKEELALKRKERREETIKREVLRKKKYYQENKEKHVLYMKKYYQENKEKAKKYRQENKEKHVLYMKKYYQEKKEELALKRKERYQKNKKEITLTQVIDKRIKKKDSYILGDLDYLYKMISNLPETNEDRICSQ